MATSMSGRVTIPTFSELAHYTSAQLAIEVVEEVLFPLFVLFRRHQSQLSMVWIVLLVFLIGCYRRSVLRPPLAICLRASSCRCHHNIGA